MLTIFAIPKPFEGHIGIIQKNAIQSWKLLSPDVEIILFGNEEGIAETVTEFQIKHVPAITCNEFGTPLLSHVFQKAKEMSQYPLLCYVNSDIILMDDFLSAVRVVARKSRFLMVGRRWNVDITAPLKFQSGWQQELRETVTRSGAMQREYAIDYFVYPRDIPLEMPPFALGRPYWDNWMIRRMRQLRVPVIDATEKVMIVHQNHPAKNVYKEGEGWTGPEAKKNLQLAGGEKNIFTLIDATHQLGVDGVKPALTYDHLRRRADSIPILHPMLSPLFVIVHGVLWLLGPLWRAIRLRGKRSPISS